MVGYILQIAHEIEQRATANQVPEFIGLLSPLAEELDRLDPRDFSVGEQYNFVIARVGARTYARDLTFENYISKFQSYFEQNNNQNVLEIAKMARRVIEVLAHFDGHGSYKKTRSFAFISDSKLQAIIERDYKELTVILFPGGAWKSTVIMAGSILEAILFDVLANNPARKTKALASSKAPKIGGVVKPIENENWKLFNLIEVATDIGILPPDRAETIDQVLRDYRNFVHPNKEVRSQHQCDEPEGLLAKGALEGVCNHLEQTL